MIESIEQGRSLHKKTQPFASFLTIKFGCNSILKYTIDILRCTTDQINKARRELI